MLTITLMVVRIINANEHFVKSVRIRCYSGPYFPAFGLNTERYSVFLRIQSECGKIRTRIIPNLDTFYVVKCLIFLLKSLSKLLKATLQHLAKIGQRINSFVPNAPFFFVPHENIRKT